jgi:general secretion pathway protein G
MNDLAARPRLSVPACARTRAHMQAPARARTRGFTLIELLVVLGIVALLLTLAVPRFFPSIDGAKETILAENLRSTRAVIDQFYADTGRYPESLDQLVEKKYLPSLPFDPVLDSPGKGRNGAPYTEW